MIKKVKSKKGNEIIQVIVILSVLSAAAITVCIMISNQLKKSAQATTNKLNEGTSYN